jgi:hypothetical protein
MQLTAAQVAHQCTCFTRAFIGAAEAGRGNALPEIAKALNGCRRYEARLEPGTARDLLNRHVETHLNMAMQACSHNPRILSILLS